MVSSSPVDAAEIVRRVSNGEGLLSNDGVSICNLVTGDATRAYVTTAAIKDEAQGIGDSKAFLGFFLSPSGYLRSFTLFLGEFLKERFQARRTRRSGVTPQMHRGMKYAGMRAASNVLLRDVNVSLIIEEMYRGANVIYADFTDYDELAHHCGPERVESLQALDGVDEAIGTLAKAAEDAPRPYKFIVLSDHGQSLGLTFKQRYGQSLGEVVRDLMGGRATVMRDDDQGRGVHLRELLPVRDHPQPGSRADRGAGRPRRKDRMTASSTSTTRRSRRPPTSPRSPWSDPATWVWSGSPATITGSPSRSWRSCIRASSRSSRRTRESGCSWFARRTHGAVAFGPRGRALPRARSASKGRIRRRSSARIPS